MDVREIDAIASRAEQQLEDHHSQLDGRYAIQFFRKFLSAANLTIEADWNRDMDSAPRGGLAANESFLACWPEFSDDGAAYGAFQTESWFDASGTITCSTKCLDPHFPDDWQPTAWKPLNPPGEG